MKVAILGTRGIPNYHGGFEQFAEFFAVYLAEKQYEVYVYNSSNHPFRDEKFKNVNIIHCYDPEEKIGTVGQFIYDLNCIRNSRRHNFDIILQLGYTSSSVWHRLLPKESIIITNMDGLEWKRSKYSKKVQKFLKYAEKLAVKSSNYLVADSVGIQDYLQKKYNVESNYIAYGAETFNQPDVAVLKQYDVEKYSYDLLIARLEPENNIETILDGVVEADLKRPFLVIGKHDVNQFGKYLKEKYNEQKNIKFIGGVYNLEHLNNLRHYSNLYFHGHSVGGTNPSLLEAMASNALIIAHDNHFNKAILKDNAYYFDNADEIANYLLRILKLNEEDKIKANRLAIETTFNWNRINQQYKDLFENCLNKRQHTLKN